MRLRGSNYSQIMLWAESNYNAADTPWTLGMLQAAPPPPPPPGTKFKYISYLYALVCQKESKWEHLVGPASILWSLEIRKRKYPRRMASSKRGRGALERGGRQQVGLPSF